MTRTLTPQKAVRRNVRARIAFMGIPGAGKTRAAILSARGLVGPKGRICLISTEIDGANFQIGLTDFDEVMFAPPYDVSELTAAIQQIEQGGYDAIIVDSFSHFWRGRGGLLAYHAQITAANPKLKFSNWSKVGELADRMMDAVLGSNAHVILCLRSKVKTKDVGGRIVSMGMQPIMREEVLYDLGAIYWLHYLEQHVTEQPRPDHSVTVYKDRYGVKGLPQYVDESFGQIIAKHLAGGVTVAPVSEGPVSLTVRSSKQLKGYTEITGDNEFAVLKGEHVFVTGDRIALLNPRQRPNTKDGKPIFDADGFEPEAG